MYNECMPTLQVREVPEHIYDELVRQAKRDHRSIAQQAVAILARGLDVSLDRQGRLQRAFEKAALNNPRVTNAVLDPVQLIREDRDKR